MLKLTDRQWSIFSLVGEDGIFMIKTTSSSIDGNKLNKIEGNVPYITRTDSNNGIAGFYDEQTKYTKDDGNCITVGLDTQTAFYQPVSFYTGQNIQVLISKHMSEAVASFFLAPLKKTLSVFNWGSNGATLKRLSVAKIMLPVTSTGEPDYDFMEQYVQEHRQALVDEYIAFAKKQLSSMTYKPVKKLEECEWGDFQVQDIFTDIVPTKGKTTGELVDGKDVPYIAASQLNNGFVKMCSTENHSSWVSKGNCILFVQLGDGAAGYAHYEPVDFIGMSGKTACGYIKDCLNEYNGPFIARCLSVNKEIFSHALSWTGNRLLNSHVQLPITPSGEPDYEYMEQYVKNTMIIKIQEYLNFASKSL